MTRYAFHVSIHARSPEVQAGSSVLLRGVQRVTLEVSAVALAAPFNTSFEQVAEKLAQLPRLYCEPDGSFVWVSSADEAEWQLDGNLYDRHGRLLFLDLKGNCPQAVFDQLLATLGWPVTEVMFQLVHEALFLDEATFRAYAAAPA